jgi:hypothetical protein
LRDELRNAIVGGEGLIGFMVLGFNHALGLVFVLTKSFSSQSIWDVGQGFVGSTQAGKHQEKNRSTGILGTDQANRDLLLALGRFGLIRLYGGLRNGLVLAG